MSLKRRQHFGGYIFLRHKNCVPGIIRSGKINWAIAVFLLFFFCKKVLNFVYITHTLRCCMRQAWPEHVWYEGENVLPASRQKLVVIKLSLIIILIGLCNFHKWCWESGRQLPKYISLLQEKNINWLNCKKVARKFAKKFEPLSFTNNINQKTKNAKTLYEFAKKFQTTKKNL